jgi:hypothetical protein
MRRSSASRAAVLAGVFRDAGRARFVESASVAVETLRAPIDA